MIASEVLLADCKYDTFNVFTKPIARTTVQCTDCVTTAWSVSNWFPNKSFSTRQGKYIRSISPQAHLLIAMLAITMPGIKQKEIKHSSSSFSCEIFSFFSVRGLDCQRLWNVTFQLLKKCIFGSKQISKIKCMDSLYAKIHLFSRFPIDLVQN